MTYVSHTPALNYQVNHYELISLIDSLMTRTYYMIYMSIMATHAEFRRQVPLQSVSRIITTTAAMQARALVLYGEATALEEPEPEATMWLNTVTMPEEIWEWVTTIESAETWDEIPFHKQDECTVCVNLELYIP